MKKNISQDEIEILEAIKASESLPTINWDEYLEETYAKYVLRTEQKRRRQQRRRVVIRRSIIAASVVVFLLISSALMSVLMPPPNAQAETWYEKVLVTVRGFLRMETAPGVVENIDETYVAYQSIDDARRAGYTGYAPTYIPDGFSLTEILILQGEDSIYADYQYGKDEATIIIQYRSGANSRYDALVMDEGMKPFHWGEFIGYSMEHENGVSLLSCVNSGGREMINVSGDISAEELVNIVMGMEEAASDN